MKASECTIVEWFALYERDLKQSYFPIFWPRSIFIDVGMDLAKKASGTFVSQSKSFYRTLLPRRD